MGVHASFDRQSHKDQKLGPESLQKFITDELSTVHFGNEIFQSKQNPSENQNNQGKSSVLQDLERQDINISLRKQAPNEQQEVNVPNN